MQDNTIVAGDCLPRLRELPTESVDLVFVDPPFNIGYAYDVYNDKLPPEAYLAWCADWLGECARVVKPTGSLVLVISDEYAAELKVLGEGQFRLGECLPRAAHRLTRRQWIIWHYTFGNHCDTKLTRSHGHLFHFVKSENAKWRRVLVPSARQTVYKDKRAASGGRTADDVWYLRPQDAERDGYFAFDQDTWHIPRVNGNAKERQPVTNQLPLALLSRVIQMTTDEGDLVLDPMCGSGTTLEAAARAGRRYWGMELSADRVELVHRRLAAVTPEAPA